MIAAVVIATAATLLDLEFEPELSRTAGPAGREIIAQDGIGCRRYAGFADSDASARDDHAVLAFFQKVRNALRGIGSPDAKEQRPQESE